jgi:hypothetical protein
MDTTAAAAAEAPHCQCCRRELHRAPAQDRTVCCSCEDRIAEQLLDVAALWEQLPAYAVRTTVVHEDTGRVTVSAPPGSAAPGDLGALDLMAGGVVNRLIVHEDAWRRELRKTGRWPLTPWRGDQDQTLRGVLAFLTAQLPWACLSYDDVPGLARDLTAVLRDMRAVVTGDRRRTRELAAPCPLVPDDAEPAEDGRLPPCGGVLVFDPQASLIRCRSCGAALGREDWTGLAIDAGVLPVALPDAA